MLHTTGTVIEGGTLRYPASKSDCDVCVLTLRCSPNTPARQIPRDLQEDARGVARTLAKTEGSAMLKPGRAVKGSGALQHIPLRSAHPERLRL